MDLDGDRRLDFHEFYAAVINKKVLFSDENISKLFKIFDNNENLATISNNHFRVQLPT